MTARRETITAQVMTRLAAVPGVAIVLREPNAQPSTVPALTVQDRGQRVIESGGIHNRYLMTLVIGGFVAGANGAVASAALNDLYAAVMRALLADGDQLGGLAEVVTEADMDRDVSATDARFTSLFELVVTIQFIARTHDPALI